VRGLDARQTLALLLIGVLAGTCGIASQRISLLRALEQPTIDARYALRGAHRAPSATVVVGLDSSSIRHLGTVPIPRRLDARLVDNLRNAGARVIAFDLTLEQESTEPAGDLALARALARAPAAAVSVVVVRKLGLTEPLVGSVPFDLARLRPGYTLVPVDSDGVIRHVPREYNTVPSLSSVAATLYRSRSGGGVESPPHGALIDFLGPAGTVPSISFLDVLRRRFDDGLVRNKIVVIGPTSHALGDLHATAVGRPEMSGAEIHANAIETALDGFPLRAMSPSGRALLLLALGLGAPLLLVHSRRARLGRAGPPVAALLAVASWTAVAQALFNSGTVVDYVGGVTALLVSYAAAVLFAARVRRGRGVLLPAGVRRVDEKASSGDATPAADTEGAIPIPATKVFVSYSHEGERAGGPWMNAVRSFADLLNEHGVDADLDQYGNHLDRDWSLWGPQAVEHAEVIVCIASPDYLKKWQKPSGSGVADEARTIRAKLAMGGKGVLFVVLPGRSATEIPLDMRTRNYAIVPSIDAVGIEDVLRLLTNQPRTLKPPPRTPPHLPPT